MSLGKIDHSKQRLQKIGTLHSEDDLADITIQVEGERFPSHRVILSAQSSVLKELLYNGEWEREITLTGISAPIFRDLLDYFYTGQLSQESTLENYAAKILDQARRFNLELLHRDVVEDMCACLLTEAPVTEEFADFLDKEADTVIKTDMFVTLPQSRVLELLSRDTFCVRDEIDIFRAALRWSEGKTKDERTAVLNTVRLPLILQADLVGTVWPSGVIPNEDILRAMDKQANNEVPMQRRPKADASTVPQAEISMMPDPAPTVADENRAAVAGDNIPTTDKGASVITGENSKFSPHDHNVILDEPVSFSAIPKMKVVSLNRGASIITGDRLIHCFHEAKHDYPGFTAYIGHRIEMREEHQEGIQFQLEKVYYINTVQLNILDKDIRLVSYYIEVSRQRDGPWTRFIDYSRFKCRGRQLLYFQPTEVRYVKVVGTASTVVDTFGLTELTCSYTESPLPMTQGLLETVDNQALEAAGALLMQGTNNRADKSMLDGIRTDSEGFTSSKPGTSIKVTLLQPVWVGSLRFSLERYNPSAYSIDVSVDDETWIRVADKSEEDHAYRPNITFSKRPVSFIRFTCPIGCELRIIWLECPDKGNKGNKLPL